MKRFDPELPIVLGLAGGYATGKTTTAHALAPAGKVSQQWYREPTVVWDHLYFAIPLYRMATARQTIEGDDAYDRQAYEVHATLLDVFGNSPLFGAPTYNDLVETTREIMNVPIAREGKPRTFLQFVGTEIMRGYDENVWVRWMDRKIKKDHQSFLAEQEAAVNRLELMEQNPPGCTCETVTHDNSFQPYYGVIISDCRFRNELQFVRDHPNGILLKLEASPEVVEERQEKRDGTAMDAAQKSHSSEKELKDIPLDWYDEVINTDNLSIEEQVRYVQQITTNFTGAAHA